MGVDVNTSALFCLRKGKRMNKEDIKILIAVPCKADIPIETVNSLMALDSPYVTSVRFLQGSLPDDARENMATDAIEEEFTHVLWIDSDMVFDEDALIRLVQDDRDCVTGLAFKRTAPYTPCIYKANKDGNEIYIDYPKDSLFEISACGCAFQLVKVSALKAVRTTYGTMYRRAYPLGEDISFAKRWTELGGKIYCDSRVKVGHIGKMIVTEKTWDVFKQSMEKQNGREESKCEE